MKSYEDLFEKRGRSYDSAMRQFPEARRQEFLNIANKIGREGEFTLLDIPAGGGYLEKYLGTQCLYHRHEPCSEFGSAQHPHGSSEQLVPTPFNVEQFDVICSLAGLHHVIDKVALFEELHRVAKPNAQLIVCDVAEGSAVAKFLDEFVGEHNSTGHEGFYINSQTEQELLQVGWSIVDSAATPVKWQFEHEDAMVQFCTQLFDIQDVDRGAVLGALQQQLGFQRLNNSHVELNWNLHTLTARKAIR